MKIPQKRDYSLVDIECIAKQNISTANFLEKFFVSNYEEFIENLYDEIDLAIFSLEKNPQYHTDDEEDKITDKIILMLQMRNFVATQGTTSGGNVDLTVQGLNPQWTWIGEAKIFNSINDLREGFLQLTTRYRNASPNFACRGILAYTKRPDAASCLKQWGDEIEKMGLEDLVLANCARRPNLAFYSTHKDKASGLPVRVRHNAICLYHLPEDKSGRTAKKYKGRRST